MRTYILRYRFRGLVYCVVISFLIIFCNIWNDFNQDLKRTEAFLTDKWSTDCVKDKNEHIKICSGEFAIMHNVLLKPSEPLDKNRNPLPIFTMACDSLPTVRFHRENHLNDWYGKTFCAKSHLTRIRQSIESQVTIMVRRYEYANIYHTMTDFYNVYILMKALGVDNNQVTVLLWDYHPPSQLDNTWSVLYKNVQSIRDVVPYKMYMTLVWSIIGYNSPLSAFNLPEVPYIEEFSDFFLKQHGVQLKPNLNCDKLSILFIWRHDYVANPDNPTGLIQRKILNELEIITAVRGDYSAHSIQGVQLDSLSMKEQLKLISSTDILIGMHGAGLTNTMFLPKHSGLIELFPYSVYQTRLASAYLHFESITRWRSLKYLTWRNPDKDNQFQLFYTRISPDVIIDLIGQMKDMICH